MGLFFIWCLVRVWVSGLSAEWEKASECEAKVGHDLVLFPNGESKIHVVIVSPRRGMVLKCRRACYWRWQRRQRDDSVVLDLKFSQQFPSVRTGVEAGIGQ